MGRRCQLGGGDYGPVGGFGPFTNNSGLNNQAGRQSAISGVFRRAVSGYSGLPGEWGVGDGGFGRGPRHGRPGFLLGA